jgi:EAL domain-containing protein (putative c-di-GMP-specific phosphodiesterase class I)
MLRSHADYNKSIPFGHRRIAPHVCVADRKLHIQTFLADKLEDLGFISHRCADARELRDIVAKVAPELVVLGTLSSEEQLKGALATLALDRYIGRVMLFGGRASSALPSLIESGDHLGLSMLPPLLAPFRDSDLQDNLAAFLPVRPPPRIEIEADEAVRNDWLELWYRAKIDLRGIVVTGAHAEARIRHPTWGVLSPSSFLVSDSDPKLSKLAETIISRAMTDWARFRASSQALELTLPMPTQTLEDLELLNRLCLEVPDSSVFTQLTIEVPSIELARDPTKARAALKMLTNFNIGISIDDVTANSSWIDIGGFPISELQVNSDFIADRPHDRNTAQAGSKIVKLAKEIGARATATDIETSAVFKAVHEMGFDLGEGDLFGKAMDAQRFARTVLRRQPR